MNLVSFKASGHRSLLAVVWLASSVALLAPPVLAQEPALEDTRLGDIDEGRRIDLDNALRTAREAELESEVSVKDAEDRADLWQGVLLLDSQNPEAVAGYRRAKDDLRRARTVEEEEKASESSREQDRRNQLQLAQKALQTRDFTGAEQILTSMLAANPDDPTAHALLTNVHCARDARRVWRLVRNSAIVLGLLGAIGVGSWGFLKKKKEKEKSQPGGQEEVESSGSGVAAKSGRGAIVKVVDGVGRGRLVPVSGNLFRIGSVQGDSPESSNDLIISDSRALVSRYHCTILRRGKKFFLVDSSLNGTQLNGRPLGRGDRRRLADGDEITIAGVSRLKFLFS